MQTEGQDLYTRYVGKFIVNLKWYAGSPLFETFTNNLISFCSPMLKESLQQNLIKYRSSILLALLLNIKVYKITYFSK